MSSNPQKQVSKMCKSPKSSFHNTNKTEKIIVNEYENLNTNCTVIGSNNLHLVKKPQMVTSMSPAYSNPSPSYPQSPYSSPASLKSPSPQLKPPTPQPNTFPVMQIIHNSPHLLARPIQATTQQQNIIKLKPHLNILPKPSASPQPSPKPSVSPQIVIPTNQQATIMPTAQPLLLNNMSMLAPGVQFILRPQATKIPTQVQTATATPQGLILQPSGQPLLQLQPPRSQPMVRVLTNGVQLAPPTTTYVTQLANPAQGQQPQIQQQTVCNTQSAPVKKKPKKKQKLDLANIMKMSGIGNDDDINFESDTSQSESEPVQSQPNTPQPQLNVVQPQQNVVQQNLVQAASDATKKIGNIQISAVAQPTINATATPLVQVLNQNFQSSVIPNSSSQTATAQSIPFHPFITPNLTIHNGLMLQRSGGFKLTVGEDGRLMLQHDPTLNHDLNSQLILQSLFGLNGGLVLQPSIDQQVHSQTVQTIQQQSVQTIQQQTVQSQTIQTVQQQTVQPQTVHQSLQTIQQTIQPQIQTVQPQTVQQTVQQTIQHQTVQSQPISTIQQHSQPMQIVQPQPIQNLNQSIQSQTVHSIQSQVQPTVHSIQSQIQGQIQSLLSQNLHNLQQNQTQTQNLSLQAIQAQQALQSLQASQAQQIQTIHSQPQTQSIQSQSIQAQPQAIQSQSQVIQSQTQSIQSQPQVIQSQSQVIQSQPQSIQAQTQSIQTHPQSIQTQSQSIHSIQSQPQSIQPQATAQTAQSSVQSTPGLQSQPAQSQQTVPTQPVLKVQPFQKSQPPVQTVHPQPIQTIHHPPQNQHSHENQTNPPPTSYVVNLTPEQLEQLKRNGQLTVNGQTIFMQRPNSGNKLPDNSSVSDTKSVKLSPKIKPVKKVIKSPNVTVKVQQDNLKTSNNVDKTINHVVKDSGKISVNALQSPVKNLSNLNHVQQVQPTAVQPIIQQKSTTQPSAIVQPSVQTTTSNSQIQVPKINIQQGSNHPKVHVSPTIQTQSSQTQTVQNHSTNDNNSSSQEVDKLLGQLLEESNLNSSSSVSATVPNLSHNQPPQRVHTIQLTPQKQQHLKNIQMQIQSISARLTPSDTELHNTLKMLFQEQQKILASGKLLPPDKVFYNNLNNQLTIVNPTPITVANVQIKTEPGLMSPHSSSVKSISDTNVTNTVASSTPISRVTVSVPPSEHVTSHSHSNTHVHPVSTTPQSSMGPRLPSQPVQAAQPTQSAAQNRFIPNFTKAQLIEQQLNTDQNGAIKPDIHTPFKDKADACKRLIRYHCFDQPVLSTKDLNKADEIFELTARHFIDKFARMVDKYRYLLLKESTRHVQTSELMMLDRMFLAEEQQSLIRLRQELEESPPPPIEIPSSATCNQNVDQNQEEYDEWACIQRELGCIPSSDEPKSSTSVSSNVSQQLSHLQQQEQKQEHLHQPNQNNLNQQNQNNFKQHNQNNLKQQNENNFKQYENNFKPYENNFKQFENNFKQQNQNNLNEQNQTNLNQQNLHHQQLTQQHGQQQHGSHHSQQQQNQQQQNQQQQNQHQQNQHHLQSNLQLHQQQNHLLNHQQLPQQNKNQHQMQLQNQQSQQNIMQAPKRSASSDSRLETLKKFRVDKHNKKSSDSVHNVNNTLSVNNVHNAQITPITSQSQLPILTGVQNDVKHLQSSNVLSTGGQITQTNVHNVLNANLHQHTSVQRHGQGQIPLTQQQQQSLHHLQHGSHFNSHGLQSNVHGIQQHTHGVSQNAQSSQHTSITQNSSHNIQFSQHIIQNTLHTQHITHTVHHTQQSINSQQSNNAQNTNNSYQNVQSGSEDGATENNSIDEQVQSAIDSILNLQQSTSLDLDDAVSSILS